MIQTCLKMRPNLARSKWKRRSDEVVVFSLYLTIIRSSAKGKGMWRPQPAKSVRILYTYLVGLCLTSQRGLEREDSFMVELENWRTAWSWYFLRHYITKIKSLKSNIRRWNAFLSSSARRETKEHGNHVSSLINIFSFNPWIMIQSFSKKC